MEDIEKEWLRSALIPEIVKNGKLTDNGSISQSVKVLDISLKYIGCDESFMLTNCYKAHVNYEINGKQFTCHLMVKKTPNVPEETYDAIDFENLFSNEIFAYTVIFPTMIEFAKSSIAENSSTEKANIFPISKFYYSERKHLSGTVVLEDFSASGWRMSTKRVNLSLEHILLAVEYIGTFHGMSYALKNLHRNKFNEMIAKLKECRYAKPPHPKWLNILKTGISRSLKAAKEIHPEIPKEFLDQLKDLTGDCFEYGKKRVIPIEPFANLCHGDYLRNNIAFRYDNAKIPDLPTAVMMFDFQTIRYSSPMIDVTTLLSLSCGKEERCKNFNNIFSHYYNNLVSAYKKTSSLMASGKEIPEFMNCKNNLLKEYIRYLPYSLGIASAFLMQLHDPQNLTTEELLQDNETEEEIIADILSRGGKPVDIELAALVKELYELTTKYEVDIFNEF